MGYTDSDILWEEPPSSSPRSDVWPSRLAPFMERAGIWGRLPGDWDNGTPYRLRNEARIPSGKWEFRGSTKGCRPGRMHIWVRYLGPED